MTAAYVKVKMNHRRWKEVKSTLTIDERWKIIIKEAPFYDNMPASVCFYAVRANCLMLNDR